MIVSTDALEGARLIDRLERLARKEAGDLNAAQWEALRYLARANRFSRTPAALADYLASTRGTISRTLAALEAKGYVVRAANARDGRSVEFELTERARAALEKDPLLALAGAIDAAGRPDELLSRLKAVLAGALAGNGGRPFGACFSCRHFRGDLRAGSSTPHHCMLLDEKLTAAESRSICVEQKPRAA